MVLLDHEEALASMRDLPTSGVVLYTLGHLEINAGSEKWDNILSVLHDTLSATRGASTTSRGSCNLRTHREAVLVTPKMGRLSPHSNVNALPRDQSASTG